jgi:hypothetical protein
MKTLNEILNETNWGGICGIGTDKSTTHNYIDGFYECEFFSYKNKQVKVLEIGISSGHSLLLWDRYFENHTGVYGIENYAEGKNVVDDVRKNEKITIIINDGYDKSVADSLPNFDIIIDDGPHTLSSMLSFIDLYLPKLNNGGVLVIEDVQSLDWMPILRDRFFNVKMDTDEYAIIDLRASKGRYDDLMFVVRRK